MLDTEKCRSIAFFAMCMCGTYFSQLCTLQCLYVQRHWLNAAKWLGCCCCNYVARARGQTINVCPSIPPCGDWVGQNRCFNAKRASLLGSLVKSVAVSVFDVGIYDRVTTPLAVRGGGVWWKEVNQMDVRMATK